MPPTMSSFGTNTFFGHDTQPGLILYEPQSDREGCWDTYHSPTSPSELPSSPSMNKASQNRFFVWVAIIRPKLNPIGRYVCPMIGCEYPFGSLELMLQHLPHCSRLPYGLYYCVESGRNEKVGKCSSPGCQDLRGRFLTAVNSGFKSVKRHFSGRSSKTQHHTEANFEQSFITPREVLEMNGEWDPISELSHSDSALLEMDGLNFEPSELSAIPHGHDGIVSAPSKLDLEANAEHSSGYNNYQSVLLENINDLPSPPAYASQWKDLPSGMDTQDGWMYSAGNSFDAQFGASDQRASDNDLWMGASSSQQTCYVSTSPQTYSTGQSYGVNSNIAAADFCSVQDAFHSFPRSYQTNQVSNTVSKENNLALEQSTPLHPVLNESSHAAHFQTRTESGMSSDSDTAGSATVFSNASSISTRDSSISSIDMTYFALDDNQSTPAPLFGSQSNNFFEEPESMYDELDPIAPLALPARNNYHQTVNSSSVRRVDSNEVSIDDFIHPRPYLLNSSGENYEPSSPIQTAEQEIFSPSETIATLSTEYPTSFEPPTVEPPRTTRAGSSRRTSCRHCKREQRNLSNIPRHERACKMNPNRLKYKPYKCPQSSCAGAFSRLDNLHFHQKKQGHSGILELSGQFTPTPISSEMRMALDEREKLMMVDRAEKLTRF